MQKKHNLKIGTIEDLISYRIENESFIEERVNSKFDCNFGTNFKAYVFRNSLDGREHLAIVKGDVSKDAPVLVRVHNENVLGDIFGHNILRSGDLLKRSLELINDEGCGVIVYLRQENVASTLGHKVSAYDQRDYGVGAQILRTLGVKKIKLISNHASKKVGLKGYGIEIVDVVPLNIEQERGRHADL